MSNKLEIDFERISQTQIKIKMFSHNPHNIDTIEKLLNLIKANGDKV